MPGKHFRLTLFVRGELTPNSGLLMGLTIKYNHPNELV